MTPESHAASVRLSVLRAPCSVAGRRRFVAKLEATSAVPSACSTLIILAVDKSASMRGRPLRAAQAAACALVDHLDDRDEVGLLSFHRVVDEMVYPAPLTPDSCAFLKEQILAMATGRCTNLGEAWRVGLRLLGEPQAVGRLVLLSDGEPSVGILGREELEILDEVCGVGVNPGPEVSAPYELAIDLADQLATNSNVDTGRHLVHHGDGAAFRRDSMPDVVSTLTVLSRRTSVSSVLMLSPRPDHGDYE